MTDILLITPPFTQLNTPYPATAYIKGFLNTQNIESFQVDLGIEVILAIFSRNGLSDLFQLASEKQNTIEDENSKRILALQQEYIQTIDAVILFLQGHSPNMARQICTENFLPQASRFNQLDEMDWAFGNMGMQDKAKHLCTLYLEDLSDFISTHIDAHFGFSRYAERLGRSANSFDELQQSLQEETTYVDRITLAILEKILDEQQPKLICFSVPFPGNLYSAFRCAEFVKQKMASVKTVMGGGFPNTELRSITDVRVFQYFDFISLDDGERPLQLIWQNLNQNTHHWKRTFVCENNTVIYKNNSPLSDFKQAEIGTPDYSDLPLKNYISVIEIANPMHSLWSDGRWNKLTMAHGCYWGKCTFCDISLDYIRLYEPIAAKILVDRMEEIIAKTGENGFHFVDEAAPPALMREVALEILKRRLVVTWWTNIRFEKSFSHDLCQLLKESGCIAVSGGLEVASDRLLQLIDKGVSVTQVANVTRNLTEAGIMVHAYLMYGYPTQTVQETVDSLEMVRQLFELGIIQSGFWHQFALTAHSPIGQDPQKYGLTTLQADITFADNDVEFIDSSGIDHSVFSFGLKKSLFNFMHGLAFDQPVHAWFDFKVPKTSIAPSFLSTAIEESHHTQPKPNSRVIWLNGELDMRSFTKSKKGQTWEMAEIVIHSKTAFEKTLVELDKAMWLKVWLKKCHYGSGEKILFTQLEQDFETHFSDFLLFWNSKPIQLLRSTGWLAL